MDQGRTPSVLEQPVVLLGCTNVDQPRVDSGCGPIRRRGGEATDSKSIVGRAPSRRRSPQHRGWIFTSFSDSEPPYVQEKMSWLVYQRELCPETKKEHWQGALQMKNKIALSSLKKIIGEDVHLEPMKGSYKQAKDYCTKQESRVSEPKEFGNFPEPGRRSDLEALHTDIKEGKTLFEIVENHFEPFLRYSNGVLKAQAIYQYERCPIYREVHVTVWYGPTGTGKSTELALRYPDAYFTTGTDLQWWDSYRGQTTLIIDEFYGQVKCTDMLSLLQPIRKRLGIKGGHVYAMWERVYIISNVPPWKWYKEENTREVVREAFKRRIHEVHEITKPWFERCSVSPSSAIEVGKPLILN